jgi:methionine synthase II (cobalamin-independent)
MTTPTDVEPPGAEEEEVDRPVNVDPDCGLKTRTVEEARGMLRVIQEARDEVRGE